MSKEDNSQRTTVPLYKKDSFLTEAKTFDEIDDGAIDLLSVDIEGGEWFVVKQHDKQANCHLSGNPWRRLYKSLFR